MKTNKDERQTRESVFFDKSAQIYLIPSPEEAQAFFTAPTAMENRFILGRMGEKSRGIEGAAVLDLGCGDGIASVNFARLGMRVDGCDISQASLTAAMRLAERENMAVTFTVSSAEELDYPDNIFDFVYLNGILHHVADVDRTYREIRRVLKPGGRFFAIEPLVGNPAIWIYRRLATKVRSHDEAPLTVDEVKRFTPYFARCGSRSFWLLTQLLFMKYYFIDRVHPNDDRYWRRIYRETERSLHWWKPLRAIDHVLTRMPLLRRWAYSCVFYGQKEEEDAPKQNL